MDNENVSVNIEIVKELFDMAHIKHPDNYTDEALLECVFKLKSIINPNNVSENLNFEISEHDTNNILVVDDIGIVTYQLKILLKNLGYNVLVSKDIFGALNFFVNNKFDYIIMDLFVSTEQEGYTLLHETKKMISKNNLSTKIIVITASSKAENKVKCLNGGADIYLKKDSGWQDKLIQIIENQSMGINVSEEIDN